MGDIKSSNRVAWAKDEGIYRRLVLSGGDQKLRCVICGKQVGTSALSRASHGKKHVRAGEAVTRTEYSHDGPRTVYEVHKNADCDGDPSCRTHQGGKFGADSDRECRRDVRRY